MKKILFTTDFSSNSNHAFDYAISMARAKKAKLILLYVYNLPLVAPVNAFTSREQTLGLIEINLKEAALKHMEVYTDQLDLMADDYVVVVREGNVSDEIARCCKKELIDLIVMGTKGKTNHRDFLMGSTTVNVSSKTSTPLLAIPENAEIRPIERIVFAIDLLYNSNKELDRLVEFSEINDATLTFLHLNLKGDEHADELHNLKRLIQQQSYKKIELISLPAENVIDGLKDFLKDGKTDLIALSNHTKSFYQKLFHKSVSREMLLQANIPLLIFSKEVRPVIFF